ncbi:MAG: hypothetical protein QME42_01580 [bacterium]|nr:hypothetical protein [bacterium]
MKYLLAMVITILLSSCGPQPSGEWVEILNNEKWYQEYNVLEKNYIGVVYDKGELKWAETKEEYNRYFLELWYTTYQLHSPVDNGINLQEFVGKKVEIVGKEKEFVYGKRKVKKILPGKIRRN